MSWEPGTRCVITYDFRTPEPPVEGDLLASTAGAAYKIVQVRRSPSKRDRAYLQVERLPRGSVKMGDPGVWPLVWYHRSRRPPPMRGLPRSP